MKLKFLILILLNVSVFGCAGKVTTYNSRGVPEDQLATVIGTEREMKFVFNHSSKIFSRIAWAYNADGEKVIDRGWSNSWGLTEAYFEQGNYVIVAYCGKGAGLYATPHIGVSLESSKKYILTCEEGGSSPETRGRIRAVINEIDTTK